MGGRFNRPRVVVCAPSGITEVERRAVEEASLPPARAQVQLIEESLAAAIGAGLEIAEPIGRMVVDVGGGTSEVAIISLGGIVVSRVAARRRLRPRRRDHRPPAPRAPHGGRHADAPRRSSSRSARRCALGEELEDPVRGRDLLSGLPREVRLTAAEVRAALEPPVAEILAAVHDTLEETPPELAADITTPGHRAGRRRRAAARASPSASSGETGMEVAVADEPLLCVALGAGQTLEELDALGRRGAA